MDKWQKQRLVLIVDDNSDFRKYLIDLTVYFGFNALEAENGKLGLEQFQKNNVDFIISDIDMPIMDGLTFLRTVRKIDKKIPFLVTTAGLTSWEQEALTSGANYYCEKNDLTASMISNFFKSSTRGTAE